MSKSNKNKKPDRYQRLKDATRDRDIRAARHQVKQIINAGDYEDLDLLEEPILEREDY
jgi:hypothetical protein